MQLPSTESMPSVRTHRFDTTIYAHILAPEVSSQLVAREKDAVLCAVARTAQHAQGRYCWVSVATMDDAEASGAVLLRSIIMGFSGFLGSLGTPMKRFCLEYSPGKQIRSMCWLQKIACALLRLLNCLDGSCDQARS